MADGSWKWCMCKNVEWTDVSTLGNQVIQRMCTFCGGKVGELEGELKLEFCPRCGDDIPEDNDITGEGPVYWKLTAGPMCSMECVIYSHRQWLEAENKKNLNAWFPSERESKKELKARRR